MTSKTKLLKKGKYTSDTITSVPAKKAEKTGNAATKSNESSERNKRKTIESRSRARRMRSILKLGVPEEKINEMFSKENNRMVLVLLNGQYTIEDGVKKKEVVKRNSQHKVVSKEIKETPNILHGYDAAKKYIDTEKLNFISGSKNAIWILSDKDNVESVVEKLKILGRVSVTKPELHTKESVEHDVKKTKKAESKPTNNTNEAKKNAKDSRKAKNMLNASMRPYYAALRKGGINARIKRHNPTLAKKIEKWLKEHKKAEAEKAEKSKEYRAKHRQLTSLEMKANKRARKAAKHLAAQERRREREKKQMEYNAKLKEKRAQKAQKPVQTELKMAA